uniref:hypothetical protein n=1 Tax=Rhizomonospora bruguierae TaxID=1581705 RepID=UPI001BD13813|nr:hypothetical protein [Micromonospora sp. NBRC 107566]
MPPQPHRPPDLQGRVFRGAEAIRRGLLTEHQLRSQAWIRLRQDVYADARLDRDHTLVCRAVALRTPPGIVIAGPSAAYLHGIDHAATFTDDVHIIAPTGTRVSAQRGLRIHVTDLPPNDIIPNTDPPRTTIPRTAWDIALWLPPPRAVAVLDTMLRLGHLDHSDLHHILTQHAGRRGSRRASLTFDLADGRSPNPTASQLRTRLTMTGLPRPEIEHPITLAPDLVLLPDLAWPTHRVAIEYSTHRIALLTAAGWLTIHVPPGRTRKDFPNVLREIRQALHRRGWQPEDARAWAEPVEPS